MCEIQLFDFYAWISVDWNEYIFSALGSFAAQYNHRNQIRLQAKIRFELLKLPRIYFETFTKTISKFPNG